jgi:hypothetical protein
MDGLAVLVAHVFFGAVLGGSTEHPLLAPALEESIGVPESLGTADIWGHGTRVAGIAAFSAKNGSLAKFIANRQDTTNMQGFRLAS